MIHFDRVPKPIGFYRAVRKPGKRWLLANPNAKRPKDLWSLFKPALADGFRQLCAYSAMYEPVGTVDHFISWKACKVNNPMMAYEWKNYRFASEWLNKSKQNADAQVLDPHKVQDGWFEILLPSLQLVVSTAISSRQRAKAEYTLERLHLGDDERIIRQRREWYRMLKDGELNLEGLRKKAPSIAEAVQKWYVNHPGAPLP